MLIMSMEGKSFKRLPDVSDIDIKVVFIRSGIDLFSLSKSLVIKQFAVFIEVASLQI